ncbi:MAG: cation-translocating P-type ATPase, partial [Flavitalea sp.]
MQWHQQDIQQTFETLQTTANGLTSGEVASRLERKGYNEIVEKKKKTPLMMFLLQFKDFMIIVLIGAAVLAGVFGDVVDTVAIILIVILNAIIGFIQEYRAEKAIDALKMMAASQAVVLRDGHLAIIPAREIVTGDIVKIEAGNTVPADLRLIETFKLKIDEASLTGESSAVEKDIQPIPEENIPLGDRKNMAYKGTNVVNGRATAAVVATGMETELGKIAQMLQGEEVKTPLQKRLAAFGKNLAYVVLAICAIVFAVGLIRGEKALPMLLTAISLAVAAIPEALPAVITIALALGAKKMLNQNALIRRLPAVETLGSITYICSDKTGTLTQNKMTVEEIYIDGKIMQHNLISQNGLNEKEKWLLQAMALNNDVIVNDDKPPSGDSTEIALVEMAKSFGIEKNELEKSLPRIEEIPFDADRKSMTTIHRVNGKHISFTKGALDMMLQNAAGLPEQEKKDLLNATEKMASNGLRVLGFAMKHFDRLPATITPEEIETDLTILGAAGLMDPPREEAMQAVKECKTAGIKPVIITGDHPLTAKAIATRLGIIEGAQDRMITGSELALIPETEFADQVKHISVYARVTPGQKLQIVKALQDNGEFVGMTGDGVNDAPSLKQANIGVAMGITGTDVSKEAADMILLDDNFATIVKSIKSGRRIYENIRKFIKYLMTSNSGEIWCIFLAPFFGLPVPLLPIHILWINLVTDGLPGLALAYEPAEKGIM